MNEFFFFLVLVRFRQPCWGLRIKDMNTYILNRGVTYKVENVNLQITSVFYNTGGRGKAGIKYLQGYLNVH